MNCNDLFKQIALSVLLNSFYVVDTANGRIYTSSYSTFMRYMYQCIFDDVPIECIHLYEDEKQFKETLKELDGE